MDRPYEKIDWTGLTIQVMRMFPPADDYLDMAIVITAIKTACCYDYYHTLIIRYLCYIPGEIINNQLKVFFDAYVYPHLCMPDCQ